MVAVLRFVDSIAAAPTVRLDVNDLSSWGMNPETTFGIPPLNRTASGSLMSDGEYITASSYGNREINLVLNLMSTTADAAATQLQLLHRELNRPTNILQYQPGGATSPVFFRTFRASPDSIQFDPTIKRVRVTLPAEPFALGTRIDLGPFTVNNDPAAGSNGLFVDLASGNAIVGDVETPLFIDWTSNDHTGGTTNAWRAGLGIGVRAGAAPYPPVVKQAEAFTPGTNSTATADAAFSGGSKMRCTFGTATLKLRLQGAVPASSGGPEIRGEYRMFLRVKAADLGTAGISRFRLLVQLGPPGLPDPEGTDASKLTTISDFDFVAVSAKVFDLGTISVGTARPIAGGYDAASYTPLESPYLYVSASRVDFSDGLDFDYIAFVPAEHFGQSGPIEADDVAAATAVWDGPNDQVYSGKDLFTATPDIYAGVKMPAFSGLMPTVLPGSNRLVIVHADSTSYSGGIASNTDKLANALTMNIRYWPRYLHVRPATT